jgi:Methyltransferase domain
LLGDSSEVKTMAAREDITAAMVDAGVRTLMAGNQQRTPAQIVTDIFTQMKAAQGQPSNPALNTQSQSLRRFVETKAEMSPEDTRRMEGIRQTVAGYSEGAHYAFFKHLLASAPIKKLLILGVYHGRDVAYLMDAARALGRSLQVVGVDKFSDDFCQDWPKERHSLNWQQAGFGTSPSFEAAQANIARLGFSDRVTLIKERDEVFLASCSDRFDAIYIDTSHDYDTVARQIRQTVGLLTDDGLLCGDDYSDQGTWGVKRAINEFVPGHVVFANWIWLGARDQVKIPREALAA